jgi:hypothetical protein
MVGAGPAAAGGANKRVALAAPTWTVEAQTGNPQKSPKIH